VTKKDSEKHGLVYLAQTVTQTALASMLNLKYTLLGTVAQTCNLSNLGGRDREDCSSWPAQAKSLRSHLNQQLGAVALACYPS
jgi:hypothetical protein